MDYSTNHSHVDLISTQMPAGELGVEIVRQFIRFVDKYKQSLFIFILTNNLPIVVTTVMAKKMDVAKFHPPPSSSCSMRLLPLVQNKARVGSVVFWQRDSSLSINIDFSSSG